MRFIPLLSICLLLLLLTPVVNGAGTGTGAGESVNLQNHSVANGYIKWKEPETEPGLMASNYRPDISDLVPHNNQYIAVYKGNKSCDGLINESVLTEHGISIDREHRFGCAFSFRDKTGQRIITEIGEFDIIKAVPVENDYFGENSYSSSGDYVTARPDGNVNRVLDSYNGSGVTVAVLDTGVKYDHVGLNDSYVGGYDFEDGDSDPMDDSGHGTQCAGIAVGDNVGMAPNSYLWVGKTATNVDVVDALDWIIDNNTAEVVSMSFHFNVSPTNPDSDGSSWHYGHCSDSPYFTTLQSKIEEAYNNNITIVASSGNSATESWWVEYTMAEPGCYNETIAVGSARSYDSDSEDPTIRATYSTYSTALDVMAPGEDVNTTDIASTTAYSQFSGTSAAAPYTAGVMAVFLDKYPGWSTSKYYEWVRESADDNPVVCENITDYACSNPSGDEYVYGPDNYTGYGFVDALDLLNLESNRESLDLNHSYNKSTYDLGDVVGLDVNYTTTSKYYMSMDEFTYDNLTGEGYWEADSAGTFYNTVGAMHNDSEVQEYTVSSFEVQSANESPTVTNPSPSGVTDASLDTKLSVKVSDPEDDPMNVSFKWGNGFTIQKLTNVSGTVETNPLDLEYDTTYEWYAVVTDGINTVTTDTYSFTTTSSTEDEEGDEDETGGGEVSQTLDTPAPASYMPQEETGTDLYYLAAILTITLMAVAVGVIIFSNKI